MQVFYNISKTRLASGLLVFGTTPIKALLMKTTAAGAYDPDLTTVAAVLAFGAEADATAYVRKTLASVTVTTDNTNNRANVDAANITWTTMGGATNNTPPALLFYDATTDTNDTSRIPIAYYDSGFGFTATNGGDWVVAVPDFLRLV